MKGKINQWNDEKGFGFIIAEESAEKVFFHISSVKTSVRRPQVGDIVIYESGFDSQNRPKAKAVVIEGATAQSGRNQKSQSMQIAPPKKNVFDYLLIVVLLAALGKAGLVFYQANQFEAIIPYTVLAVVALLALNRQKKPKEKQFSCSRCKAVVDYDSRTIHAWNRGALKFYCSPCHQRWLQENPVQKARYGGSRGGGCLGSLCLLVIAPIAVGISIYQWLA